MRCWVRCWQATYYVPERLLRRGGHGAVYQARHQAIGRAVAIKVLLRGGDEGAEERFHQEPLIANRVLRGGAPHPNVVAVTDVGRDATHGSLCIVQELLRGERRGGRLRFVSEAARACVEGLRAAGCTADQ